MLDLLRRRLQAGKDDAPATEVHTTGQSLAEIRTEYGDLIRERLERAGIAGTCFEVDVRHMGAARDGRDVLAGMVRITRWERQPVVRLLLGLPLLEKAIRRKVRASWLAETTWFGGLWLHASTALLADECGSELRALIAELEHPESSRHPTGSTWASVGPEDPSVPMPIS